MRAGNRQTQPVDSRSAVEWFAPLAGALSLLAACIITSSKKPFWNDELYSWYFLSDRSLTHMWQAFNDEINNTPGLYFLVGWLWSQAFGSSELSLRLFSSVGFGGAILILWMTLRKIYGFWPSSIGISLAFLTSRLVLLQNAEARMYGIFALLCVLLVYQYDRLNASSKHSGYQLAGVAILHAAVVHTHIYGLFYSAALLAACVATDVIARQYRFRVYAAIVAGQATFVFYLPSFLAQAEAARPRGWIPSPTLSDLFNLLGPSWNSFGNIALITGSFLVLVALRVLGIDSATGNTPDKSKLVLRARSLLILAFAFLSVLPATWLISRLVKPIFLDRYLVPSVISYSIFIAHFNYAYLTNVGLKVSHESSSGKNSLRNKWIKNLSLGGVMVVSLGYPIHQARQELGRDPPGAMDKQTEYSNLPIVFQSSHRFLETLHYHPGSRRYFFVLDRESAYRKESGSFGAQEFNHLSAFKRQYPRLSDQIVQSDEFLRRFDRFLVVDHDPYVDKCSAHPKGLSSKIHCPQWVEMRLLRNPRYAVTEIAKGSGELVLLVVAKSGAGLP